MQISQVLLLFIPTAIIYAVVGQYGAVSAMDLSKDGTRLLCGHAKGLVSPITVLWCNYILFRLGRSGRREELEGMKDELEGMKDEVEGRWEGKQKGRMGGEKVNGEGGSGSRDC